MIRRRTPGRTLASAMDWARYLADRLIVIPAADLLPRGWALAVADLVGYIEALVPAGTTATARER